MKKVLLLMVAVMLIVGLMAGPALASDPDDAEQGAQGFHGFESFYLYAAEGFFDTPGKMFQSMRNITGENPPVWLSNWEPRPTVGEFIYTRGLAAETKHAED